MFMIIGVVALGLAVAMFILYKLSHPERDPNYYKQQLAGLPPFSSPARSFIVFINRNSGKGTASRMWECLQDVLQSKGQEAKVDLNFQILYSETAGHEIQLSEAVGKDLAEKQTERTRVVVVILGGDGYVCNVVNGLYKSGGLPYCTITVVPAGSGNGVACSTGCRTLRDSAQALLGAQGACTPYDLVAVQLCRGGKDSSRTGKQEKEKVFRHGDKFVSALSVAFGAVADHDFYAENKFRWLGPKHPFSIVTKEIVPMYMLAKCKHYRARVAFVPCENTDVFSTPLRQPYTRDGKWIVMDDNFLMVQCVNVPWIASDACFVPAASTYDGCVYVCICRNTSRLSAARMFIECQTGAHVNRDNEDVEIYAVSEFCLLPHTGDGHMAIDGELLEYSAGDQLSFTVLPRAAHALVSPAARKAAERGRKDWQRRLLSSSST
mmetsp:Transcript_24292/g.47773  ORF Transcript_24292/g.47773 Transcript_24292/m.47773 type:complete len:436 (-) Transcript_24292:341-1648(-)